MAVGESRAGRPGRRLFQYPGCSMSVNLPGQDQPGQGRAAQPSPTAAICSLPHRLCLLPPPTLESTEFLPLTFQTVGKAQKQGGVRVNTTPLPNSHLEGGSDV